MRSPLGSLAVIVAVVVASSWASAASGQATASSGVTRFVVEQRRAFADGTPFGEVGPYERLDGTAFMELDPSDPLNAVILNLDKVPRNARGKVEFSAPFFILKPADISRGNGKLFFALNNRGNKQALGGWNFAPTGPGGNDPLTTVDAGDGFLMRQGYTIVDAGWQGDVIPSRDNKLAPKLPVPVQADGSPIVGMVRIEYSDRTIPAAGTFTLPLEGSPDFRSYATADADTSQSTLTVRDCGDCSKVEIASDRWAFGACSDGEGSLVETTTDICLFDGFRNDRLYELLYPARDPMVMGLAYAGIREIGSFLRYQARDEVGNPNPLTLGATTPDVRHSYGYGNSSTGMYFRDFLYLGFNEDLAHRKVFDAVWINIPGSQRLFANVEFADPNTYSRQDDREDFLSTSHPPMTLGVTTDPVTGIRDGILKRPATDPLVFQTVTELEFWQFRASLDVADGSGQPVDIPSNVRLYFLSNFQHAGSNPPTAFPGDRGMCQNATNPNYHGPTRRALLVALDDWVDRGLEPPANNYPDVRSGTLVAIEQARAAFPAIPGVQFPAAANGLRVLDFGPEFGPTGGRLTVLPPIAGPEYRVLVPQVDEDGLDLAGIRPVEVRAPLGTNTGWNLRAAGHREGDLCALNGSFIPFKTTHAERLAAGDPRRSLEERYSNHEDYVRAVDAATSQLVKERFLLPEDAVRFVTEAEGSKVLR
jgi:hypothetical protein